MKAIIIPREAIAVSQACTKEADCRPNLEHVRVRYLADVSKVDVCATDGHMLARYSSACGASDDNFYDAKRPAEDTTILVKGKDLQTANKAAKPCKKDASFQATYLAVEESKPQPTIHAGSNCQTIKILSGDDKVNFPPAESVFPTDEPKAVVGIDPALLMKACKILQDCGCSKSVRWEFRGPLDAIVAKGITENGGEVLVLVMPIRM